MCDKASNWPDELNQWQQAIVRRSAEVEDTGGRMPTEEERDAKVVEMLTARDATINEQNKRIVELSGYKTGNYKERITELEAENVALKAQVETLVAERDALTAEAKPLRGIAEMCQDLRRTAAIVEDRVDDYLDTMDEVLAEKGMAQ